MNARNSRIGWYIVAALAIFFAGMSVNARSQPPHPAPNNEQNILDTLAEILAHPVCLTPMLVIVGILMVVGGTHGILYVIRESLVIKHEWVTIQQEQQRVHDLTMHNGSPVPRVIQDTSGQKALLNANITTRPVTAIDANGPVDSEQLRAAALVSQAMTQTGRIPPLQIPQGIPATPSSSVQVVPASQVRPWLREVHPQAMHAALTVDAEVIDEH